MKFTVLVGAVLFNGHSAQAFYLPGVHPKSFKDGDSVELKVNKMTSIEDPFPLEYYHLPFCVPPGGAQMKNENLGEFLNGDRIESSPYKIQMKVDMYCEQLCTSYLGRGETSLGDGTKKLKAKPTRLVDTIRKKYHNNWIIDNLPAASRGEYVGTDKDVMYWWGFPVGEVDPSNGLSYVNNHVNIELKYHTVEEGQYRIVGFIIQPFSINHELEKIDIKDGKQTTINAEIKNPIQSCRKGETPLHTSFDMARSRNGQLAKGNVLFTYDVLWAENKELHWASRWDVYLNMDNAYPTKVHWMSIANSMAIVLILSAMIVAILLKNFRRDVDRYNRLPTDEERADDLEEFGWKLVHADVFRPPSYPMLMSICCGTGIQILLMSIFTITFACMGFLSPSNRGSLLITLLLLYVFMGFVAGYTTARMYKTFKGKSWQKATTLTAFGFPGITFTLFFILNLFTIAQKSGDAVPFHTMVTLMFLWFGISSPLVFFGAFLGFKKDAIEFPVNTSHIPRQIPDQPWFMNATTTLVVGGIMPFGACFLELFFIMSSVWMHQYYYVFGVLFVVFLILLLTCAEITTLYNYFLLCGEDYHWWWRSFTTGGSVAFYVFGYSVYYFKQLEANSVASYALYFGYMGLASLMIFLMTGSIGLYSSLYFNKTIFASIKID